ncbi:hypothetical protein P8452_47156 [Trifolium repens]|nr:hypothetical protein P8452_47156 [Trifolium repens]
MILALQIGKNYTTTCSVAYWILNLLQVPVAVGVSSYEAVLLYKGKKVIASKGDQETNWSVKQLVNSILFMWHNCWQERLRLFGGPVKLLKAF